ncbi:MAG TPA: hypothetical protein PL009_04245 [Flavipsychrobacter sp.]|nr:hypothetical protein [Flavipsychrobacter sp.]
MKKIAAFLLGLIIVSNAKAQVPVAQQWHAQATSNHALSSFRSYDWIFDVIQTSKKEYIAVGYTRHVVGTTEYTAPCYMKLDHKGKIVWIKKVLTATGTEGMQEFSD